VHAVILSMWMRMLAREHRAAVSVSVRERGWHGDEVWTAQAVLPNGRTRSSIEATPWRAMRALSRELDR